MRFQHHVILFLLCVPFIARDLEAGQPQGSTHQSHMYTATPTKEKITLDGRLTESAWSTAVPISNFEQRDPDEGEAATETTTIRFLYDDRALYVGVELLDSKSDEIVVRTSRRDDFQDGDYFQLYLDPYHDHTTGAMFQVNAAGSLQDSIISNDTNTDTSWDAVWDAAVSRNEKGWYIEMRIPFSQLRFAHLDKQTWGVNAARFLFRRNETSWLERVPKQDQGMVSRFAHLTGIDGVEPGHNIEILPYLRGSAGFAPPVAGDPFHTGRSFGGGTGVDIKYGLGSNLTIDGSVNPDFGQVEVDPAVVNLSAFETFFQEKRPFFIEGSQIFNNFGRMGGSCCGVVFPTYFYSRRIGRSPQGVATGDFISDTTAATILGAAKLTGKPAPGWTVGLLNGTTNSVYANVLTGSQQSKVEVEPFSNYFVGRVLREYGNRGGFGTLATGVDTNLDNPSVADIIPHHAYVIGGDGYYYFDPKHTWSINGRMSGSWVSGDPAAMNVLQTASQRYLQRPDATNLHYNPNATSMKGWSGGTNFSKNSGGWTMSTSLSANSPGFDSNEAGFLTNGDTWGTTASFNWRQIKPDRFTRNRNVNVFRFDSWNFNRDRKNTFTDLSANFTFMNYWGLWLDTSYNQKSLDDRLLRGGPMALSPQGYNFNGGVNSDGRRRVNFGFNAGYYANPYKTWSTWENLNIGLKPSPSITVNTGPSFNRSYTYAQYVDTVTDPTAVNTFGSRYVFSGLDQSSPSLTTRVSWSLTPKMSLQVFSQILLASGRYWGYREFAKPGTFSFLNYGQDIGTISNSAGQYTVDPDGSGPSPSFTFADPNFNFKSNILNAVFRWEWKLGSALFIVWQQNQTDSQYPGAISAGRDIRTLFGAPMTNLFLVKTTYWFNR